jgi:DNA/RNA-binding domain of Phe-tRNA-synthetase-like protein
MVHVTSEIPELVAAIVEIRGAQIGPACDGLRDYARRVSQQAAANGLAGGEARRSAIRALLRSGGFKPAGRSKPAQEYLLRTVTEQGELPSLVNAVDLINAASLETGLPISLVSLDRLGERLVLRYGRAGERYVFNRAGQELDLEGLIALCAGEGEASQPAGTPVKDSMAAKVDETDRHLLVCIYASAAAIAAHDLLAAARQLAERFQLWCGAECADVRLLSHPENAA